MKAKYILCAVGIAMLSASCSDFLEENPKGKLASKTFFATKDELTMATYALYKNVCLTQTNTNPTIPVWQGDDITANPGSNKQAYAEADAFSTTDANKGVEACWSTAYLVIKAANYIIINAEKTPATEEAINIALGQAKYWRAYHYFKLVRRWGPVPLVLNVELDYERPLASVQEVYEQIIKDLQDCIATLPTDYSEQPQKFQGANIYITKQAAQSTLSAVYMAMAGWPLKQTQYYAQAAEQAKAVIDGVNAGTYEYILEPEYKYVYAPSHNYTNETVVGINFSRAVQTWAEDSQMTNSNLFESLGGGWGDAWGEIKFWKEFPEGPRKDATYNPKILKDNTEGNELIDWWEITERHPMFCIFTIGENGGDYDYTKPANTSWMTNDHRHRLIRYSEVLLWYAESQARADGSPNALAYECINKVRERAGLEPLQAGLSGEAFADAAAKEHGWEVAGYFVGMVTRRDDQMRLELLQQTFEERKVNAPIEVAPGVSVTESVIIPSSKTWEGEKSIYLPYPASDAQLNSNLTR